MANAPTNSPDWAWPALIHSLQRDISYLRDLVDEARRDSQQTREAHRRELNELIDQLRELRSHLEPLLNEREANTKAVRDLKWTWSERVGWGALAAIGFAVWHYLTNHLWKS